MLFSLCYTLEYLKLVNIQFQNFIDTDENIDSNHTTKIKSETDFLIDGFVEQCCAVVADYLLKGITVDGQALSVPNNVMDEIFRFVFVDETTLQNMFYT